MVFFFHYINSFIKKNFIYYLIFFALYACQKNESNHIINIQNIIGNTWKSETIEVFENNENIQNWQHTLILEFDNYPNPTIDFCALQNSYNQNNSSQLYKFIQNNNVILIDTDNDTTTLEDQNLYEIIYSDANQLHLAVSSFHYDHNNNRIERKLIYKMQKQ